MRRFQPPFFKAPTPWPSLLRFLKSLFTLPSFLIHPLLWFYELSATKLYTQDFENWLLSIHKTVFSTRQVLNVHYLYVLIVRLGGLLFMKFKMSGNIKFCLSHFLAHWLAFTHIHLHEIFLCQNKPKKWKNWKIESY